MMVPKFTLLALCLLAAVAMQTASAAADAESQSFGQGQHRIAFRNGQQYSAEDLSNAARIAHVAAQEAWSQVDQAMKDALAAQNHERHVVQFLQRQRDGVGIGMASGLYSDVPEPSLDPKGGVKTA